MRTARLSSQSSQPGSGDLRLLSREVTQRTTARKVAKARLLALAKMGAALAGERNADRLLRTACVAARDLFGATYVTAGIVDGGGAVQNVATSDADVTDWIGAGDPVSGLLATVAIDGRVRRGENLGGDPASLQLPARHPEVRAFLGVPIALASPFSGWICLVCNEGRRFTDDDELLVTALSGEAGGLYDHIREHASEQRSHGLEHIVGVDLFDEPHRHAQKMEAIGQLAGGVAHDFNNLLTVILGYGRLLLDTLDAHDPSRADIAEIHKAAISASTLTRQLLACIRRDVVQPALIDLNAVVEGMQVLLARLLGENMTVVVNLGPKALVFADRGQIEQIILNLAVNARDAMPLGGAVTIGTATTPGDGATVKCGAAGQGPWVTLTVSDTGSGMTSQAQARLFEPFFTTKAPGKGTGLGLATVHGIVTRLGGSIGVRTDTGVGTSFTVRIPQADAAGAVADMALPVDRPPPTSQKILLVEDADGPRALVARMLRRHGYNVVVAADADQAGSLFQQDPSIALVLTDVILPGCSGPDLSRNLLKQRPGLKVIYMSGYPDEALTPYAAVEPGVALLRKPFADGALLRTIHVVLES